MKDKIKNILKKAKDSLFRVAPMLYIEETENHFDRLFGVGRASASFSTR